MMNVYVAFVSPCQIIFANIIMQRTRLITKEEIYLKATELQDTKSSLFYTSFFRRKSAVLILL